MSRLELSANYDSEVERKERPRKSSPIWHRSAHHREVSKREDIGRPEYGREVESLYARHRRLVEHYASSLLAPSSAARQGVSDMDVIAKNHRFIWKDKEISSGEELPWELALAKKYWDRLFKEYAICDLSRYLKNQIAMRWRTQKEVQQGKGQFYCGSRKCSEDQGLRSWEVNFAYEENKVSMNALVKIRLCPDCSYKLNYCHKKKDVTKSSSKKQKKSRRSRKDSESLEPSTSKKARVEGKEDKGSEAHDPSPLESQVWKELPSEVEKEKSREDNFSEYLEDLFL